MTDTLTKIHQELDEALDRILWAIQADGEEAIWRLDDMVEDFTREQMQRPRTIAQLEQLRVWRALMDSVAQKMVDDHKKHLLIQQAFDKMYHSGGSVTFPVYNGPRPYSEQRRLYEQWKGRVPMASPGTSVHRVDRMAIGLPPIQQVPREDWSDFRQRFNEPWHFEYPSPKRTRKPWWRRAWKRFTDFFRSVAW